MERINVYGANGFRQSFTSIKELIEWILDDFDIEYLIVNVTTKKQLTVDVGEYRDGVVDVIKDTDSWENL